MGVKVIYADVLFLINFTVDFMCLYITRALVSAPARVWRIEGKALYEKAPKEAAPLRGKAKTYGVRSPLRKKNNM